MPRAGIFKFRKYKVTAHKISRSPLGKAEKEDKTIKLMLYLTTESARSITPFIKGGAEGGGIKNCKIIK